MSVLIVGSTALDSIATPRERRPRMLGGSASHAAVAASFFSKVKLVGIVGDDFPEAHFRLYRKHGIDLEGLQIAAGKTFHWSGEYEANMNNRHTLATELGVFETFAPRLPESYRDAAYVLLANIAPGLQHLVLDQTRRPKFVAADTMAYWMDVALRELLTLLKRVDGLILNESEARQLTGNDNLLRAAAKIHKLGPKYVIVKKGEHGAILSGPSGLFLVPAYPLTSVTDPTGAGDSFAGAMMGCLAASRGPVEKNIRRSLLYASVVASFCCEGFGLTATTRASRAAIEKRAREMAAMTRL